MTTTLRTEHYPRHRRSGPPKTDADSRAGIMRASAIMAAGSLLSRALGFVRTFLFGVVLAGSMSAAANAFSAANTLPETIWILVGGGTLNAILVPAIVRAMNHPDRGEDFISRLMTLVAVITGAITLICIIAVPLLITLTSGILPPATMALAVQMGLWMMPQIFFSAIYVMYGQLLNAHNSFGPYQWAPVLNNLVAIIGALIFLVIWGAEGEPGNWTMPMIITMALINVGGSVVQVIFLRVFVGLLGFKLTPKWGFRGLGLGKLGKLGLWTMGMLGLGQLAVWANRWATGGAVAMAEQLRNDPDQAARYPALLTLQWAYLAFMIPQGIIAVSLITAVFPTISRHAAEGHHDRAMSNYSEVSRVLVIPMMLATVVFMALATPIMWVIGGGTGPVAAEANGRVLAMYMLGLIPFSSIYLIKRVFFAYEDGRTPFLIQVPVAAVAVIACPVILLWVNPQHAAAAAALSTSLSYTTALAFGLWCLHRHSRRKGVINNEAQRTLIEFGKLLVCGVITFAVGWLLTNLVVGDAWFHHRLLAIVIGAVIGAVMSAVFVVVAWLLQVQELRTVLNRFSGRLRKRSSSSRSPGPLPRSRTGS